MHLCLDSISFRLGRSVLRIVDLQEGHCHSSREANLECTLANLVVEGQEGESGARLPEPETCFADETRVLPGNIETRICEYYSMAAPMLLRGCSHNVG